LKRLPISRVKGRIQISYKDLNIPEGALYNIDILEKLEFEKPHIPRHMEDSIEILDSCEL